MTSKATISTTTTVRQGGGCKLSRIHKTVDGVQEGKLMGARWVVLHSAMDEGSNGM